MSCGHANPEHAKFCLECGAPLAARCARCGTELPPAAKFCLECGAARVSGNHPQTPPPLADKIRQARSTLEGERKQVTVLFGDVKGSMELAEQMDPEAW